MSIGLAHRYDANVVFTFRSDDRDQRIAKRPKRHESFLAVVEATIFERDRQPGPNHALGVGQVKAMLLAVARLLCGIEALAHTNSMCINMCIVKVRLDEAPDVTLSTVVGLIDTLRPSLSAGELDLVVGTESADEVGFVSKLLAEDAIVVAASADHEIFRGQPTLKDLTRYRWALQPPGAPTRDWLDHLFERKRLPRPTVQVETTMLIILPSLIVQTGLLSFMSRHHLSGATGKQRGLKEVPINEAVMRRRLVVTYRSNAYLSPAASRLIELFAAKRAATAKISPRQNRGL